MNRASRNPLIDWGREGFRHAGAAGRVVVTLYKHGSGSLGLVLMTLLFLTAAIAPVIAGGPPEQTDFTNRLAPPSLDDPLGTDHLGRSILDRIIWGTRLSIVSGIGALLVGGVLGIAIGLITGYVGGLTDRIGMRIVDILLAFPTLLLALIVVAILGPGGIQTAIAIGVALIAPFARLTRGEVIRIREWDFVQGARALGAKSLRILASHILPNIVSSLIVYGTLRFGVVILTEASLGFLGLGPSSPSPAWGLMVNEGLRLVRSAWWVTIMPGIAILLTVLASNLLGDALRDILDPRTRNTSVKRSTG